MKSVIQELLILYNTIESKFQQGPYDKSVKTLLDENKGDMLGVVGTIFSHSHVHYKNFLVVTLIVSLFTYFSAQMVGCKPCIIFPHLLKLHCLLFKIIVK